MGIHQGISEASLGLVPHRASSCRPTRCRCLLRCMGKGYGLRQASTLCAPFVAADASSPRRPRAPQARLRRQWRARPRSGAPTEQRDACLEAVAARLGQPFAEGGRAIIVRTAAAAPGEPLPGAVPRCAALCECSDGGCTRPVWSWLWLPLRRRG